MKVPVQNLPIAPIFESQLFAPLSEMPTRRIVPLYETATTPTEASTATTPITHPALTVSSGGSTGKYSPGIPTTEAIRPPLNTTGNSSLATSNVTVADVGMADLNTAVVSHSPFPPTSPENHPDIIAARQLISEKKYGEAKDLLTNMCEKGGLHFDDPLYQLAHDLRMEIVRRHSTEQIFENLESSQKKLILNFVDGIKKFKCSDKIKNLIQDGSYLEAVTELNTASFESKNQDVLIQTEISGLISLINTAASKEVRSDIFSGTGEDIFRSASSLHDNAAPTPKRGLIDVDLSTLSLDLPSAAGTGENAPTPPKNNLELLTKEVDDLINDTAYWDGLKSNPEYVAAVLGWEKATQRKEDPKDFIRKAMEFETGYVDLYFNKIMYQNPLTQKEKDILFKKLDTKKFAIHREIISDEKWKDRKATVSNLGKKISTLFKRGVSSLIPTFDKPKSEPKEVLSSEDQEKLDAIKTKLIDNGDNRDELTSDEISFLNKKDLDAELKKSLMKERQREEKKERIRIMRERLQNKLNETDGGLKKLGVRFGNIFSGEGALMEKFKASKENLSVAEQKSLVTIGIGLVSAATMLGGFGGVVAWRMFAKSVSIVSAAYFGYRLKEEALLAEIEKNTTLKPEEKENKKKEAKNKALLAGFIAGTVSLSVGGVSEWLRVDHGIFGDAKDVAKPTTGVSSPQPTASSPVAPNPAGGAPALQGEAPAADTTSTTAKSAGTGGGTTRVDTQTHTPTHDASTQRPDSTGTTISTPTSEATEKLFGANGSLKPSYEVASGDNLTKILKENLLEKLGGGDADKLKEVIGSYTKDGVEIKITRMDNVIENMRAMLPKNPELASQLGLSSSDMNNLKVGEKVNLQKFYEVMSSADQKYQIGGKNLLQHALNIPKK